MNPYQMISQIILSSWLDSLMTYLGQWSARRDLNSHSRLMELGPKPNAAAYYATCRFYATYLCADGVANHPRFPLPLFNVPSHKLCISHSSLTASHVVRRDCLMTYLGQQALSSCGARHGTRIRTPISGHQILSLGCLPFPPAWHIGYSGL